MDPHSVAEGEKLSEERAAKVHEVHALGLLAVFFSDLKHRNYSCRRRTCEA